MRTRHTRGIGRTDEAEEGSDIATVMREARVPSDGGFGAGCEEALFRAPRVAS
jgi:hypothetical protein